MALDLPTHERREIVQGLLDSLVIPDLEDEGFIAMCEERADDALAGRVKGVSAAQVHREIGRNRARFSQARRARRAR